MRNSTKFPLLLVLFLVSALPLVSAQTTECFPVPNDLVAWWPGDGNANDIVGGNDGTLQNGATFATGFVTSGNRQAFSFDGFDDYVSIPDNASLDLGNSPFTIAAWILGKTFVIQDILTKSEKGNAATGYEFLINFFGKSGSIGIGRADFIIYTEDVGMGDRRWHFVAGTYDGSGTKPGYKIYLDGNEVPAPNLAEINGVLPGADNNKPALIGWNDFFLQGAAFDGLIDELQLYKRALSPGEIQAIFNAGRAGVCKIFSGPCDGNVDCDGDGVPNSTDLCTATPPGAIVDANGCSDSQVEL